MARSNSRGRRHSRIDVAGWGGAVEAQTQFALRKAASRSAASLGFYTYYRPGFLRTLYSTMPKNIKFMSKRHWSLQMVMSCFRGIGQVVFMNNPFTGALITVGMFISSPYYAVMMLIGVVSSNGLAQALGMLQSSITNGLFGYSGALTGIAVAYFHHGNEKDWGAMLQVIIPVIVMSAFSSILQAACSNVLVSHLKLSPFTFPFCLAAWMWVLGCSGDTLSYFPLDGSKLQPTLFHNNGTNVIHEVRYSSALVIAGVFKGVSQIFLQANVATACCILVGMWFCSPISAAMALIGSTISTCTAVALGATNASVEAGLWGYNGSLCAIAVGGMFFVLKGRTIWLYLFLVLIMSCVLTATISGVLAPMGIPVLTFPFVFASWIFCLAGRGMKHLLGVDLGGMTVAEDHRRRWFSAHSVSNIFKNLVHLCPHISLETPEQVEEIETQLMPVLLCYYGKQGDVQSLAGLLKNGARVNATDYDGRTALHLAAAEGHTDVVKFLLDKHGANIQLKDRFGHTCLHDAVKSRNTACIDTIRSRYTAPFEFIPECTIVMSRETHHIGAELCIAASLNDIHLLVRLVNVGVPVNSRDYDDRTALHIAASKGFELLCRVLLHLGANKDRVCKFGETATDSAANNGHVDVVQAIQTFKPDDAEVLKLLHAETPSSTIVDLTIVNVIKFTQPKAEAVDSMLLSLVVCDAAKNGNLEKFVELCGKIPNVKLKTVCDYDNRTPLHIAIEEGHREIVSFLLTLNVPVNAQDRWGHTPLFCAVRKAQPRSIRMLLEQQANFLLSPVKIAVMMCTLVTENNIKLLKMMLLANCDPNAQDYDGRTPLQIAIERHGSEEAVSVLIAAGALHLAPQQQTIPTTLSNNNNKQPYTPHFSITPHGHDLDSNSRLTNKVSRLNTLNHLHTTATSKTISPHHSLVVDRKTRLLQQAQFLSELTTSNNDINDVVGDDYVDVDDHNTDGRAETSTNIVANNSNTNIVDNTNLNDTNVNRINTDEQDIMISNSMHTTYNDDTVTTINAVRNSHSSNTGHRQDHQQGTGILRNTRL
eukprot:m.111127 g.111127  ORF g.111127 m.111127 type:complete len:1046 (-) comp28098_c0_seq2:151-3288(-)